MRIVSLLPSATEVLCALGLGEQLVGVSHECDMPAWVARLPRVTRSAIPSGISSGAIDQMVRDTLRGRQALYSLDLPVLESLRPDLIVTQGLCNVCAVAEDEVRAAACALPGAPRVLNLEPRTLGDVLETMRQVARAAGVEAAGEALVGELEGRIAAVVARGSSRVPRPRVVLLEWLDPPFSTGHWSPELVQLAGGIEGIGRAGQPARSLTWAEVAGAAPEVLVIACCGFDVERTLVDLEQVEAVPAWRDLPAVQAGRVVVFDGNQYFSRPGPRLVDSLELLAHALDPSGHPAPAGLAPPLHWPPLPQGAR